MKHELQFEMKTLIFQTVYSIRKQPPGPAPDPKCKLIISSFLTLPHLLDCLICTRNAMPIVLLLQMMGGWDRWGWLIYIRVWVGGQGVGIIL